MCLYCHRDSPNIGFLNYIVAWWIFWVIVELLLFLLSLLEEEIYWTKESALLKILISKSKLSIPNNYCGSPMVKQCLTRKLNLKMGLWIFWFLQPNHGGLHGWLYIFLEFKWIVCLMCAQALDIIILFCCFQSQKTVLHLVMPLLILYPGWCL